MTTNFFSKRCLDLSSKTKTNQIPYYQREHAHTVLVEEFREKLKKETEESNVVKADESKKACERKKEHLVAVYGSKNTNWEKLVDENSRQPFWYVV